VYRSLRFSFNAYFLLLIIQSQSLLCAEGQLHHNFRRSESSHQVAAKTKPSPKIDPKPDTRKKCYVIMKGQYGMGFFGEFMSALGALHIYEKGGVGNYRLTGVAIDYGTTGTYYDPTHGANWWEYYFEPVNVGQSAGAQIVTTVNGGEIEHDLARRIEFGVPRKEAYQLIKKYIRLKPFIKEKISQYVKKSFGKGKVIGVHFRGTDKYHESPIAPFEEVAAHVDQAIVDFEKGHTKGIKIFVATDQQDFLDYMCERYPSKVIYYEESTRSMDGKPVHTSFLPNNYKKGEDALLDCLLLSKCDILIKTSSNLSLCSAYFNPNIPMIHVTERPWRKPLE